MNPNEKDINDPAVNVPVEPVTTDSLSQPPTETDTLGATQVASAEQPLAAPNSDAVNAPTPSNEGNSSVNTPPTTQGNTEVTPTPADLPTTPLGGSSMPASASGAKSKSILGITIVVLGVLVLLVVLGMMLA